MGFSLFVIFVLTQRNHTRTRQQQDRRPIIFHAKKIKKNQKFNNWQLTKLLGCGGNGEVWEATNDKKEIVAIKFKKKIKEKDYSRFLDEILILENHSEIKGIMPLSDKILPNNLETDIAYNSLRLIFLMENPRTFTILVSYSENLYRFSRN